MIRKSVEECWNWHWEFRFRKYTFRHLQDSIDKIKQNRGVEERYMLLEEMMWNERQEGKIEGKQEFLFTALESKFSVPSELKEKIMSETDIEKLNLWFQFSLKVSSLEEFEQNM